MHGLMDYKSITQTAQHRLECVSHVWLMLCCLFYIAKRYKLSATCAFLTVLLRVRIEGMNDVSIQQPETNVVVLRGARPPSAQRQLLAKETEWAITRVTAICLSLPLMGSIVSMCTDFMHTMVQTLSLDELLLTHNDYIRIEHVTEPLPQKCIVLNRHMNGNRNLVDTMVPFILHPNVSYIFGMKVYAFRKLNGSLFKGFGVPKTPFKTSEGRHTMHAEMLKWCSQQECTVVFPCGWSGQYCRETRPTAVLMAFALNIPIVMLSMRRVQNRHLLVTTSTISPSSSAVQFSHSNWKDIKLEKKIRSLKWPAALDSQDSYTQYREQNYAQAQQLTDLYAQWSKLRLHDDASWT